jgi:predicted amidohydrolase YtcJ
MMVCASGEKEVDMILTNGTVYGADANDSKAEAVAVKDGKIIFVGNKKEIGKYYGQKTKVIDLSRKMVLPGFIDSHLHPPGSIIRELYSINMGANDKKETLFAKIRAFVEANPELDAYYGGGWSVEAFERISMPSARQNRSFSALTMDTANGSTARPWNWRE